MDTLTRLSEYISRTPFNQWEKPLLSLAWLYEGMQFIGVSVEQLVVKVPTNDQFWQFNREAGTVEACDGLFANKLEMGFYGQTFYRLQVEAYEIYCAFRDGDDVEETLMVARQEALSVLCHYAVAQYTRAQIQKKLAESRRTFELTFEQVASGRCITDLEGWIQDVNQKFCDIIGYSLEETLQLRIKDLTYAEDWHADSVLKQQLLAGEIPHFSVEKRYIRKDGSLTWVYTTVTLMKGNAEAPDYLIGIVQDINSQKAAEEWLQHENEKLEGLVTERTRQLLEANAIKDQTIEKLHELQGLLIKNATIDALTGLYNRRYMLEKLTQEHLRAQRTQRGYCLILTDIDFFKQINDQRGHDCGDEVLQAVSQLLLNALRSIDVVCRWGGEEFLMLLPETDSLEARSVAERIRQRIQDQSFYYEGQSFNLTMTFGVAAFQPQLSIKEVVKLADRAMYQGKAQGRNQVV